MMKNEDGLEAEYLVKRWRAGSGYMQVRFAWYGLAWLLVGEALKAEEDRLLAERRRGPLLFDELNQDAKDDVDTRLAFLGTLADARKVGDYLLRRFGAEGLNPVRIPAHELRRLLQCEMSEKGHRRVEGLSRPSAGWTLDMTPPAWAATGAERPEATLSPRGPTRAAEPASIRTGPFG